MDRMVVVNLPTHDLDLARRFWAGLGFGVDARSSDARTLAVRLAPGVVLVVLPRPCFAAHAPHPVPDARGATQVMMCLAAGSRDEVDTLAARALALGGAEPLPAFDDDGTYARTVSDPDGHVWELLHTDGTC